MKFSLSACAFLIAGVSACSPYDPAGLSNTIADANCRFTFDCCSAAERSAFSLNSISSETYSNKNECVEETAKLARSVLDSLVESQAEGRIEWDTAASEECYQKNVEAANECDAEAFYTNNCSTLDFITGKVASGGACYGTYECAEDGAICNINNLNDDDDKTLVTAIGKCVAPLKVGDECTDTDIICAPDLYCGVLAGKCTAFLSVGSDCSEGICDFDTAYCDFNAAEATCAALKADGAQCDGDTECLSDDCDFTSDTCVSDEVDTGFTIVYEMCTGEPLQ